MKFLLASIFVLSSLCGMYSAASVGSDVSNAIAASRKSFDSGKDIYYRNINNARGEVKSAVFKLVSYVNATYKSLNDVYGATQPNMKSMMSNLEWFAQQFNYGEQQANMSIDMDVSQLNSQLQQTSDLILQNNMMISSFSNQPKGEICLGQFGGSANSIPFTLNKFGQCLENEAGTVQTVVTPLLTIFIQAQNDLTSMNEQLKICAPTSTSCINQYFMDIFQELSTVNTELFMTQGLLSFYQNYATQRNMLCGDLVKFNVQDATQNLMNQISQCMNPPM